MTGTASHDVPTRRDLLGVGGSIPRLVKCAWTTVATASCRDGGATVAYSSWSLGNSTKPARFRVRKYSGRAWR